MRSPSGELCQLRYKRWKTLSDSLLVYPKNIEVKFGSQIRKRIHSCRWVSMTDMDMERLVECPHGKTMMPRYCWYWRQTVGTRFRMPCSPELMEWTKWLKFPTNVPQKKQETATSSKQRRILKNKQTHKLTTSTAGSITDKARLAVSAVCTWAVTPAV